MWFIIFILGTNWGLANYNDFLKYCFIHSFSVNLGVRISLSSLTLILAAIRISVFLVSVLIIKRKANRKKNVWQIVRASLKNDNFVNNYSVFLLSQMFSGGLFCLVTTSLPELQPTWKSLSNGNLTAPNSTLFVLVAITLSEMRICFFLSVRSFENRCANFWWRTVVISQMISDFMAIACLVNFNTS